MYHSEELSVALGAADATPAFDLTDATNYPTSSLTGTITNAQLAGSIDLTSKVTGILPIANGGTGSNTAPMINIIKADNASAVNTILGLENVTNESKTTMFDSAS